MYLAYSPAHSKCSFNGFFFSFFSVRMRWRNKITCFPYSSEHVTSCQSPELNFCLVCVCVCVRSRAYLECFLQVTTGFHRKCGSQWKPSHSPLWYRKEKPRKKHKRYLFFGSGKCIPWLYVLDTYFFLNSLFPWWIHTFEIKRI